MKLAFWKRKRTRRASPVATDADAGNELEASADEAAAAAAFARVRTRRRLIGACALLLAVVVLVPMLLDPTPRAVPDNIPIELPSDKTPFAPRLPAPEKAGAAESTAVVPAAPGSAADTAADAGGAPGGARAAAGTAEGRAADTSSAPGKKHGSQSGEAQKSDGKHGAHKTDAAAPATAKIFVQAAAMASEGAAKDLANRLAKSGLTPFVERTETNDGVRFRVRLGPFASRDDAERSRARLHALGVNSNIVGV